MFTLKDIVEYYRLFGGKDDELVIRYNGTFSVSLLGVTGNGDTVNEACENWLKTYLNGSD